MSTSPRGASTGGKGFWSNPVKQSHQPEARPAQPTFKPTYTGPEAHAAVPYGQPGYVPADTGAPRRKVAPNPPSAADLIWANQRQAIGNDVLKKAGSPGLATFHDVLGAATGITPTVDAIRRHDALGTAASLATLFPFGKGFRGAKLLADVGAATKETGAYSARLLKYNELESQLPKARSAITRNVIEKPADAVSKALQRSEKAVSTPIIRNATAGERVAKAAGRSQKLETIRSNAKVSKAIHVLRKVKSGSVEDTAHFWYAQLPKTYRNAKGLGLVRAKQAEELQHIASGGALEDLVRQEGAVKAQMAAAEGSAKLPFLRDLEELKIAKTDLPKRADDIAANLSHLDDVIAAAPAANTKIIDAIHALSGDRERILGESGIPNPKLKPETAESRKGLVSRWVGLEPSGEEAYLGHRLPKAARRGVGFTPSPGTGKVGLPKGVSQQNMLTLAKSGRLRQSVHVASEDRQAAQVFEQANRARSDLGKMGTQFTGSVPEDHVLVNPRGRTVPPNWKTEDFSQLSDSYDSVEQIRGKAKEVLDGIMAEDPQAIQQMLDDALAQGVKWDELRIVPKRLVGKYYSQFRAAQKGGTAANTYDRAIDAVSTSIIFARLGYIPKNAVQNLIMSVPHQGAFLPINAVHAAQVMADSELRVLIEPEIGFTGATGSLGKQMVSSIPGKVAGVVSKIADDPFRISAFMHEAAAEGVISRVRPILNATDKAKLLRLLTDPSQRQLLNDIRSRSVEAMADFSRMTPAQAKMARRFLIIPGWLMAGSRYPFHFAVTHPIRSALLAYAAAGEPGAPKELRLNRPLNEYIHGKGYKQGIDTPWGRVRTNSLSPVNTPWDLGQAVVGSARGKTGPFDFATKTIFDEVQPAASVGVGIAQGEGVVKSLRRLAPGEQFIEQMINPKEDSNYPEDRTRWGRFKREIGVVPIQVNDTPTGKSRAKSGSGSSFWSNSGGGNGSSFWGK